MTCTLTIDASWAEVELATDVMQRAADNGDWMDVLELAGQA